MAAISHKPNQPHAKMSKKMGEGRTIPSGAFITPHFDLGQKVYFKPTPPPPRNWPRKSCCTTTFTTIFNACDIHLHLRSCIRNHIWYLHAKCICAPRSTTINIVNIFFPHSFLVFFFCQRFQFYLCFMLFVLCCFPPSVVAQHSAGVSFYYYSIYYSIVDQEEKKNWKNEMLCFPRLVKYFYIGLRKSKS